MRQENAILEFETKYKGLAFTAYQLNNGDEKFDSHFRSCVETLDGKMFIMN